MDARFSASQEHTTFTFVRDQDGGANLYFTLTAYPHDNDYYVLAGDCLDCSKDDQCSS
jgi:hypothetical protein